MRADLAGVFGGGVIGEHMARSDLAILFVDICDSTELYDTAGDAQARRLIESCVLSLAETSAAEGGRVVKTLGDGLLCMFPTADAALNAAVSMRTSVKDGPLSLRVGFHVGPVIESEGDVFGDTVNIAARVVSFAKPDEVLFTESSVEHLSPAARLGTRFLDQASFKGKSEPVSIYGLAPLEADHTVMTSASRPTLRAEAHLLLRHGSRLFKIGSRGPKTSIGRDPQCDFVIDRPQISRWHATIEPKQERYYLLDQSTNGTFVVLASNDSVYLKRESLQLVGKGALSLGRPPQDNQENLIHFEVP